MTPPFESPGEYPCKSLIVAGALANFCNCAMTWLLETANPSSNLAKRDKCPPSYEERLELTQIANEITSMILGSFGFFPEEIRERVAICMQRIEAWAGDISARQLCAFMLDRVQVSLKVTVPTKAELET